MHTTSAFATLAKFLDKPTIETDWEGAIIYMNSAAQHLFGLQKGTAQVGHVSDYLPKSTALIKKIKARKPTAEEGIITLAATVETEGQDIHGEPLSLEVSVIGATSEVGSRLLFMLHIIHAPTIRSRQQLITRLLNQAKIPMSIIDEAGCFMEVNQSFVELFGYSVNEVTGKNFTLLLSPSIRRQASKLHKSFFQTEKELQAEWDYITAEGEIKTVMVTANLLTNPNGQRLQLRTYQDITAHIQIERHFQQNEALMHHIFDFADVGIALVNTEGTTSHANLAFCALFGYRPAEIINQPFNRIFNAKQRDFAHKRYQDAMEQGHVEEDAWKIRLPRGNLRHVHTLFRRLTFPDGVTRMLIIAHDVTIEKNIRSQLIQDKEEAELKLLIRNNFLTMLSRKLRTLATPIAGFSDLLESTRLNAEQREYVEVIAANCKVLHRFAEDVVEYTHFDSDSFSPHHTEIDLNELLHACNQDLSLLLQQYDVQLRTRIASDCSHKIIGDPFRLRSLVHKLVAYAITHAVEKKVSIEVNIHPKISETNISQVVIEIIQSGSDLNPRQIEQCLQNYTKPSSSIQETIGDDELNFAIFNSIATSMDASIDCRSDFDNTIRFTVQFDAPLVSKETTVAATATQQTSTHERPLRVICADDSPSSLSVMKAMLGRMGHQIALVSSGEKLIERLSQEDYDIVCLDIHMPAMNGFEACKKIREGACRGRNVNIQIIATTAYDSAENHQQCMEIGMNGYVTKPIDRQYLSREIQTCRAQLKP